MQMSMRRFTRLTNAFSKKAENHTHALALYFTYYNFVRMHKTLRCSPAMAAGLTGRPWGVEDMVALIDASRSAKAAQPLQATAGEERIGGTDRLALVE